MPKAGNGAGLRTTREMDLGCGQAAHSQPCWERMAQMHLVHPREKSVVSGPTCGSDQRGVGSLLQTNIRE